MDGIAALSEVAYWLERDRAETHRVQAYRKASWALSALPPGEFDDRIAAATLTDVASVGAKTAGIVMQASAGQVPPYLAELRERGAEPLATGGESLRQALRGDLHCHSNWSDGGSPIEEMVEAARGLGHDYLALTDHSPRLTVAHGLDEERLTDQIEVVARLNRRCEDISLLPAIEVDILEDGRLDQSATMLDQLDVVVASVHSKLRADSETMTLRMVGGIANRFTNVLGHCTGRLVTGGRGQRPESTFDAEVVFAACAQFNVAVEVNSRPERRDPPSRLIALALEAGCLFSIDTDAHAPGQLDFLDYGCARAVACGIPAERVVNTWPLHRLLEWTHAKR
ncbi:MAG: PHP domain-containing protein [Propionibacteriales bacterium]|nr:PHP domain-containing protein [Propionibacteriales bacterium]